MSSFNKERIDNFLGADFSEGGNINPRRASLCKNMIKGKNGNLRKRLGLKTLHSIPGTGKVNGIFALGNVLYVHRGTRLFKVSGNTVTEINQNILSDNRSNGFAKNGNVFIVDGVHYMRIKKDVLQTTNTFAYVPVTSVSRTPGGVGTDWERPNMMYPMRKNVFVSDGRSANYYVDHTFVPGGVAAIYINGVKGGEYTPMQDCRGITLKYVPSANIIVVVEFYTGFIENAYLDSCTQFGIYGNDSRIFLTGSPARPNMDWCSAVDNPGYFPDDGYTWVGSDDEPICGYIPCQDYQMIIKGPGVSGSNHYLRSWELDSNGKAVFPVKQGTSGDGCIASGSLSNAFDQPLYLGSQGISSWSITSITSQRSLCPRSYRINSKLLKEPNISKSFALSDASRYYLFVNSHCYVADLTTATAEAGGFPQFEWYYLEDIPATCGIVINDKMYLGMADGRICVFKNEDDADAYSDENTPIDAAWNTPFINFGTSTEAKTVKNLRVSLGSTKGKTSAIVSYSSDKITDVDVGEMVVSKKQTPTAKLFPIRSVNTPAVQIGVRNNKLNENLELVGIKMDYRLLPGVK